MKPRPLVRSCRGRCGRVLRGVAVTYRPSGLCAICWAKKNLRPKPPCPLCGGKRERFTGMCAACCFPEAADNGDVA